jgi:hypothetical protein
MSSFENAQNLAKSLSGILALENSDKRQTSLDLLFGRKPCVNTLLSCPSIPQHQQMTTPVYRQNQNYSTLCSQLEDTLAKYLDSLKDASLEINWLQDYIDLHDTKLEDTKTSVEFQLSNDRRRRRAPTELARDHACPFLNCSKIYASRNALKLHIKRNHNLEEPLKTNFVKAKECLAKVSNFKRGVNLKSIFKSPHAEKLQNRGTDYILNDAPIDIEWDVLSISADRSVHFSEHKSIGFDQISENFQIHSDMPKKSIHEGSTINSTTPSSLQEFTRSYPQSTRSDHALFMLLSQDSDSDAEYKSEVGQHMLFGQELADYDDSREKFGQDYNLRYYDHFEQENVNFMRKDSSYEKDLWENLGREAETKQGDFFSLRETCERGFEGNEWLGTSSIVGDLDRGIKKFICEDESVNMRFHGYDNQELISIFE